MFEFVVLLVIAAAVLGVYVVVSAHFTSPDGLLNNGNATFYWPWSKQESFDGHRETEDFGGVPLYGTPGSQTEVVVLPNGELGYRNGLDLNGNHF